MSRPHRKIDDPYYFNSRTGQRHYGHEAVTHQNIAINRALNFNKNSVKQMPNEDGVTEPHVLVHRGLHRYNSSEAAESNKLKISPTHVSSLTDSVHTLDPNYASNYTSGYSEDGDFRLPGIGRVFSFWVPKSKIHIVRNSYEDIEPELDDKGLPYPDNFLSL